MHVIITYSKNFPFSPSVIYANVLYNLFLHGTNLIDYFCLFIVATGCPSDPRRWLVVTGDSARIQDETTENSAWFFNVLGV